MFDGIVVFLNNIDVSSIHRSAGSIAKVLIVSLTPSLFIIAIYQRVLAGSLDAFTTSTSGVWARAVRDIIIWGIALAFYFAIGQLIINYANDIYRWADSVGGLKLLTNDMSQASKAIDEKMRNQSLTGSLMTTLTTGGGTLMLITGLFYYLSLLVVAFIVAALRIAHSLVFGFAFIWGLIAIPISVSQGIKLLRGWGMSIGFALLWPVVQALLVALVRPTMVGALNSIMASNSNAGVDILSSDLLMTVLNFLFAATVLAAPFLASSLVNNAPVAASMVAPFVSAAMASVASFSAGAKMATFKMAGLRSLGSGSQAPVRGSFGNNAPISTGSPGPGSRNADVSPNPSPGPPPVVESTGVGIKAQQSSGIQPSAPKQPASAADAETVARRQQRRGVIISQSKNKARKP